MRWLLFVACALDYSVCKNEDQDRTTDATTRPPPPPIGPFAPGGNPLAFTAKPLEVLQQTFTPSIPEQFLQTKASNQQASTTRSFSFLDTKSPGDGVSFQLKVQHPLQKNSSPKPDEVLHVGRLPVAEQEQNRQRESSNRNLENGHSRASGIPGEVVLVGDRPVVLSDVHQRLPHKHLEREENPATHTLNTVHFTAQRSKQDGIYFVPPVTPADRAVTGEDLLNTIRPSNNIITPTDLPKIPEPTSQNEEGVEQRSFSDSPFQNAIPVQETAEPGRGSRDTGLFQDVNTGEVAPQQNTRFIQGVTGDQISLPESGSKIQDPDERMSRIEADFHNGRRTALDQGVRDPTLVQDEPVQSKVDFSKESFEENFRRQKEELERKFSAKEFDPATLSVTEFPKAETFLPERDPSPSFETPAKRQNQIVRKNPNFQDGLGEPRTKTIDFTIESKHHTGAVTTQTFTQVVPLRSRLRQQQQQQQQQSAPLNKPSDNNGERFVELAPVPPPPNAGPVLGAQTPSPAAQRQTFNRAILEDQRRYREELRLFEEDQRKYREQQRRFEEDQRRFEENRRRFEDEERRFNEQRLKYEEEKQRFEAERNTRTQQIASLQRVDEQVDLKSPPASQAPPPPRRVQKFREGTPAPPAERDQVRANDDQFSSPELQPTQKPARNRVRIPTESRHFTIEHTTQAKTPNVQVVDVEVKIPAAQELPLNHRQTGEITDDPFFPVPLSNPDQKPVSNTFPSRKAQSREPARSPSKKGFNFSQGTIYTDGPINEERRTPQRNRTSTRNRNGVQRDPIGSDSVAPESNDNSQKNQGHVDNSQNGGGDLPGTPGVDYPIYSIVPDTTFNCKIQESAGMYADIETGCQAFHNCDPLGHKMSFLCPNGTIFKQELFICDWWYNVQCNDSDKFFHLNTNKYTTPRPRKRRRRVDGKRKASA
ncbi:uncharacterized protein LOC100898294 [Galendromus occidentalis]|uniref:Uncharacterized protein LOC100898294 n=1 Tax=Galendromus occidentalis TaxID=34638 RepID=A0AAJ7WJD2_9ACAR|nr:uncharacterized protein LOC100898294 [Galendromus occidentalis]